MGARIKTLQGQGLELTWWCPQLPPSPAQAMREVHETIAQWPRDRMAIIGSSLGGFYAAVLAEAFGCPAVVLNPAVNPARDLEKYIGEIEAWHSHERFYFRAEYVEELREMTPATLAHPERYFAVIAKGDELLDWREMDARYAGARIKLIEGGDHALSDFETEHLDEVLSFLKLS